MLKNKNSDDEFDPFFFSLYLHILDRKQKCRDLVLMLKGYRCGTNPREPENNTQGLSRKLKGEYIKRGSVKI